MSDRALKILWVQRKGGAEEDPRRFFERGEKKVAGGEKGRPLD